MKEKDKKSLQLERNREKDRLTNWLLLYLNLVFKSERVNTNFILV